MAFPASLADVEALRSEHALDPLASTPLPYSLTDAGARVGPAARAMLSDPNPLDLDGSLYVWTLR
jgi:hypothetical protein